MLRDLERAQQVRRRGTWALSDVVVFLTAFAKETQKLRRVDVARADDRYQTIKDGCT